MNTKKIAMWLCLFGTLAIVVVGSRFIWNETPVSDLQIGTGMGPDLMTPNGQLNFEELKQLISDQAKNGEWQTSGTSRSIVIACSADGCRTFTYDGDGNLIPYIRDSSNVTDSRDNPFDDPMP